MPQAESRSTCLPSALRRRRLVVAAVLFAAGAVRAARPASATRLIEVWKSPSCGCCKDWIEHLRANGFEVKAYDSGNSDPRRRFGMPRQYGSCHTALVAGYAIEGHVPAREIRRLLTERPQAVGLAVPAMPIGSPGMDGPEYGGRRDPYDVLLVQRNGGASVYQSYR